jgi:hypothetical protein
MGSPAMNWEEFKKHRDAGKPKTKGFLQVSDLAKMKKGDQLETTFGHAPAQLICVETFEEPTLFRRFLVMAYGCEVAEVCAEQDQKGQWVLEEL